MCREAKASAIGPSEPGCLSPDVDSNRAAIHPRGVLEKDSVLVLISAPSIETATGALRENFACPVRFSVKPSRFLVVISRVFLPVNRASIDASTPGVRPSNLTQYAESYWYALLAKRTRSG